MKNALRGSNGRMLRIGERNLPYLCAVELLGQIDLSEDFGLVVLYLPERRVAGEARRR